MIEIVIAMFCRGRALVDQGRGQPVIAQPADQRAISIHVEHMRRVDGGRDEHDLRCETVSAGLFACCTAQHGLAVLQQDCPRLAQKAPIGLSIAVKCLQKLEQPRRVVRQLLPGKRKEKW